MSEYTTRQILDMIEANGGPEGLDLSGKDLSAIDLSREAVAAELEKVQERAPGEMPVWYSERTGCINLGSADLRGANLGLANLQWARLAGAKLQGAYLVGAKLQGANLVGAKLQGANLWLACLQGANLDSANLQEANLQSTNFQGADLVGARLREAILVDADLQGGGLEFANLQEGNLLRADLRGAKLLGANLQGARLRYSHLEKVDFFAAKSLEGAHFYNVFLDDTRLKRKQLGEKIGEELEGKYDQAKEAYLALKNNFAEIGRYRDESWAYIKERQMGKMCSAPWRARRFYGESQLGDSKESRLPAWHPRVWWFYARHIWKWFWDWVAEGTCKYGESIFRTLGTMGIALVGFTVLYRLLGAVVDANSNPSSGWWHCLLYSGGAFTTFGVDTLRPANDWIRALSIFESGVGIALTGLLGFVLGNRIRRS